MFLPIGVEPRSERFPLVTSTLIILNVAVFLLFALGTPDDPSAIRWAMVPANLYWPTLFTNLFLHAGWAHLLGNMLFLWIFGRTVEDRLGHLGYGVFYVVAGLAADAAHLLSNPTSEVPTLGASGAISGVMGAFVVFSPRTSVKTFVWLGIWFMDVIRTPAYLWIGLWFGQQLLLNLLTKGGSGVAYFAHIGGFVAGSLIALMIRAFGSALRSPDGGPPTAPPPEGRARRLFSPIPDEPDIEWLDDPGDSYSVLRLDEDPAVVESIGKVVEPITGERALEVSRRLLATGGMIARTIPRESAEGIQRELHRLGIPTAKILHNRANLPPPPSSVDGVSWDDRNLRFRSRDQIAQIPWASPFLWVAARSQGRVWVDVFLNRRTAFRVEDGRSTLLTEVDPSGRTEVARDLQTFAQAIQRQATTTDVNAGIRILADQGSWGRLDFSRGSDYDDYIFWLYNLILARSSRPRG
ncbi:MAG TPA: rhomboid family intramembrane serine protease [Planctomycetota bacterium]|nr:rhomboid family intramembrane serine protease [Planctomycetota bacterium]